MSVQLFSSSSSIISTARSQPGQIPIGKTSQHWHIMSIPRPLFTSRAERERLNYLESIKHNALKHSHLPLTPPPYDASGHAMKGVEAFPVTFPLSKSHAPIAGIEHQPQRRRNDVNPSIYPDNAAQPPSWPLFFRILIWFCKLIDSSNLVRNIIATFAILFVATFFMPGLIVCYLPNSTHYHPACIYLFPVDPVSFDHLLKVHDSLAPLQNDVNYALDLPMTMSLAAAELRSAHHVWQYESRNGPTLSILSSHALQLDDTARSLSRFLVMVWGKMEYLDSVYVTSKTTLFEALDESDKVSRVARFAETVYKRHLNELTKAVAEIKRHGEILDRQFLYLEMETIDLKVRIKQTAEKLADAKSGQLYPWKEEPKTFFGIFSAQLADFWPGDLISGPKAEKVSDAGNGQLHDKKEPKTLLEDFVAQAKELFPDNLLEHPKAEDGFDTAKEKPIIAHLDRVLGAPLRAYTVVKNMMRLIEEVEREIRKMQGDFWVKPSDLNRFNISREHTVWGQRSNIMESGRLGRVAVAPGLDEAEKVVERLRKEYPWFSTPRAVDVFL